MKNTHTEEYFEFFQELPTTTDYLNDIEIQDEIEKPNDSDLHGLSDEQVSQIALDSLANAKLHPVQQPTDRPQSQND